VKPYATAIAALALLASLAVSWQARRELDQVRRELQAVTAANQFLKKTLGDMTIAITAKDREIDRLENTPCNGQPNARPGSERRTDRSKAPASSAGIRRGRPSFDSLPDSSLPAPSASPALPY
jgi:hypothetical protein